MHTYPSIKKNMMILDIIAFEFKNRNDRLAKSKFLGTQATESNSKTFKRF